MHWTPQVVEGAQQNQPSPQATFKWMSERINDDRIKLNNLVPWRMESITSNNLKIWINRWWNRSIDDMDNVIVDLTFS